MHLKKWLNRTLILIPLALGIAAVVIAPKLKSPPQKIKAPEPATKVRVIKPLHQAIRPKAIGYGTSAPVRSWEAVAEVSGRVIWVSGDLREGKIIAKGSELLRIDDAEYKLALSQVDAQLNAFKVKLESTRRSLAVEQRSQASLKKEVIRQKKLKAKGLLASTTLEAAERNLIKADATVQNLKNTLAINKAEKETLAIQRQHALLDLARTIMVAPFDVRIVNIDAHEARFASKGQLLFSADATDKTEIEARFPIGQLRPLIASKTGKGNQQNNKHPGVLGLDAIVRLRTSTHAVEWKAKIERVAGQIDRQTQTIGVIVIVEDPYGKAKPGQRPPLIRNTFVEVELQGKPKGQQIIVPISAIHQGKVYLLDEENRLDISKVKIAFTQDRYAVLAKGVDPEEKLVVSDLIPAIQGMLLEPMMDKKTRKILMAEVLGQQAMQQKINQKKAQEQSTKKKSEKSPGQVKQAMPESAQ